MILLDADPFVIDKTKPNDPRRAINRQALDALARQPEPVGVMIQALLEVVGILSYNTPAADIPKLPAGLITAYNLVVLPDPAAHPEYAGCTLNEILLQMNQKMSLGDAVQVVQIVKYAPDATVLLTWNAKHFVGKMPSP